MITAVAAGTACPNQAGTRLATGIEKPESGPPQPPDHPGKSAENIAQLYMIYQKYPIDAWPAKVFRPVRIDRAPYAADGIAAVQKVLDDLGELP